MSRSYTVQPLVSRTRHERLEQREHTTGDEEKAWGIPETDNNEQGEYLLDVHPGAFFQTYCCGLLRHQMVGVVTAAYLKNLSCSLKLQSRPLSIPSRHQQQGYSKIKKSKNTGHPQGAAVEMQLEG